MKKLYSFFSLLLLTLLSFNASATRVVTVNCNFVDNLIVREGGADGAIIPVEANPTEFETDATELYFSVTDPEEMFFTYFTYTNKNGETEYLRNLSAPYTLTDDLMAAKEVTINVTIAQKNNIVLNVPDPSLICVRPYYGSTREYTLTEGANKLTLDQDQGFYVELTDPENWRLTKFYRVSDNREYTVSQYKSVNVYSYQFQPGNEFSYEIVNAKDFTAPSIYVTIDNPAAVTVGIDYQDVTGFEAGVKKKVELGGPTADFSVTSENSIYNVTLNGEAVSSYSDTYYSFEVADGDEVVVTAEFPEIYNTVNISVDPAENTGAIAKVYVGSELLEDWSTPFEAKAGKKISIEFDKNLYNILGVTVNGAEQTFYGSFDIKVGEEPLDIVVKAEKYQTCTATLVVDTPENVSVLLNSKVLDLAAGEENVVEFTERANTIYISAASNGVLDSVVTVLDGEETPCEVYSNRATVYLKDGMKVIIKSHELAIDKTIVVYSTVSPDDPGLYINFYDVETYKDLSFKTGYTVIELNELQKTVSFSAMDWATYDSAIVYVYLNGESVEPANYNGYRFEFKDKDVLKLYFNEEPAKYTAKFEIGEGCDVAVVKDILTAVNPAEGVSDFAGTEITITNNGETAITVKDGDNAVEAVEGAYTVVLDADKTISVTSDGTTGIENVGVNAKAANNVYTASGVLVLRNATAEQIKALPAGIYVAAGRKIVVR